MNEGRIARLEKRVRNLQLYAFGVTALLVAGASAPRTAVFDVVRARQFLVEEDGRRRATLGMFERKLPDPGEPATYPALVVEGASSRIHLGLEDEDWPTLFMADDGAYSVEHSPEGLHVVFDYDGESSMVTLDPGGLGLTSDTTWWGGSDGDDKLYADSSELYITPGGGWNWSLERQLKDDPATKRSWSTRITAEELRAPVLEIEDTGAKKVLFSAPGD